jgi:hypothetical protein
MASTGQLFELRNITGQKDVGVALRNPGSDNSGGFDLWYGGASSNCYLDARHGSGSMHLRTGSNGGTNNVKTCLTLTAAGNVGVNGSPSAMLHVLQRATTTPLLYLQGAAAQDAPFVECKTSTGSVLASIDKVGAILGSSVSTGVTPWGLGALTTGVAEQTLDSTKYVTVTIGGTTVKLAVVV